MLAYRYIVIYVNRNGAISVWYGTCTWTVLTITDYQIDTSYSNRTVNVQKL